MEDRGSSVSSYADLSHLTSAQQKELEPAIRRLSCLFKCGCLFACCTLCLSLTPYYCYMRRLRRTIEGFEQANRKVDSEAGFA